MTTISPNMAQAAGSVNPNNTISGTGVDQNGQITAQSAIPVTQNDPNAEARLKLLSQVYAEINANQQGNIDSSNAQRTQALSQLAPILSHPGSAAWSGINPADAARAADALITANQDANSKLNATKLQQQEGLSKNEQDLARQAYTDATVRNLNPQQALDAQRSNISMVKLLDPITNQPIIAYQDATTKKLTNSQGGPVVDSKGNPINNPLPYENPTSGTSFDQTANGGKGGFVYTNTNPTTGNITKNPSAFQPNAPVGFVTGPNQATAAAGPTPDQTQTGGFANQMAYAENKYQNLIKAGYDPIQAETGGRRITSDLADHIPLVGNTISNSILTPGQQTAQSARDLFIKAQTRSEFSRAQNPTFYQEKEHELFPAPGDSKEVIAAKQDRRQLLINNEIAKSGVAGLKTQQAIAGQNHAGTGTNGAAPPAAVNNSTPLPSGFTTLNGKIVDDDGRARIYTDPRAK